MPYTLKQEDTIKKGSLAHSSAPWFYLPSFRFALAR
jgi:hypothetical protein